MAVVPLSHSREIGIGCKVLPGTTKQMDNNRTAIIKLLITCFSEALYYSPTGTYNNYVGAVGQLCGQSCGVLQGIYNCCSTVVIIIFRTLQSQSMVVAFHIS